MPYQTKPNKVVIVGGGVAGLSAAHELVERGFEVVVYEKAAIPGGKARSMGAPGTGSAGRPNLPAEHGFRFFPGFYKHVTDSMQRIPLEDGRTVLDNLISVEYAHNVKNNSSPKASRLTPSKNPVIAVTRMVETFDFFSSGLPVEDAEFFVQKIWQIWSSSKSRINKEYEHIPWWDFIEADTRSEAYRHYLAKGTTTQLVASKPRLASTKTLGETGVRLVINGNFSGMSSDRVLNGPTNEAWIQPWLNYIRNLGGVYKFEHALEGINMQNGRVASITIKNTETGEVVEEQADYYILALPIEVLVKYLNQDILDAAPGLRTLFPLSQMTEWMNGIMYYLTEVVDMERGHMSFVDSPWAITAIAQAKTWGGYDLTDYADGKVKEILSVVISDWNAPGLKIKKPAMECTPEEIAEEAWYQMGIGLNKGDKRLLKKETLHSWFLDPDIKHSETNPHKSTNLEPLVVNVIGSWRLRPNSHTSIPNLFLAGDYVRTNTDIATMEAANEAARRAVNNILKKSGGGYQMAGVWDWPRPWYIFPLRLYDAWRFKRGLPWKAAPRIAVVFYRLAVKLDKLLEKHI